MTANAYNCVFVPFDFGPLQLDGNMTITHDWVLFALKRTTIGSEDRFHTRSRNRLVAILDIEYFNTVNYK